jgi:hypothetical protein
MLPSEKLSDLPENGFILEVRTSKAQVMHNSKMLRRKDYASFPLQRLIKIVLFRNYAYFESYYAK